MWFSRYKLPDRRRDRRAIGLPGYIVSIIISVLVTVLIVQDIVVSREVLGCNRRQPIFRAINTAFEAAAATLPALPRGVKDTKDIKNPQLRHGVELRMILENAHRQITPRIVYDCNKAYPKIIPWID